MIHKKEYVKDLIRKQQSGDLTPTEEALLKVAERIYGDESWNRLLDEALGRQGLASRPGLADWKPDFSEIVERARRRKWVRERTDAITRYGMVAAAMLIVLAGFYAYQRLRAPMVPSGLCADMPRDMPLPVAEFASAIRYGESETVAVPAARQGHIAQVGNLDIARDAAGTLVVSQMRTATAADTVGHPSVRFVTAPFQQSEVLLPSGVRVRLNAGSTLTYPLLPEPDVCYVRISGEAFVSVPEDVSTDRGVVGTVNSQVHVVQGEFAVLATAAETRVTLLDGQLSIISKQQQEHRLVKRRGGEATVKWVYELDGRVTESLDYRKTRKADEAIAWTKASRRYRNASLREYVADVSRWYGIKVKDIHCIPAAMRVDAMICYRAPLEEALAVAVKAGLQVNRTNGMYSFCDGDEAFRPVMANRER